MMDDISGWKDKVLFTPGPLTTSQTVKQALLRDLGSRDHAFIELVRDIRRRLVTLGGVAEPDYVAIPMQGSGTFSVEAVFASVVPRDGKVLVVENGAYGKRMVTMLEYLGIAHEVLHYPENEAPRATDVAERLAEGGFSDVAAVHCETTTGIFNDIAAIGAVCAEAGVRYFVDAMSSFGAVPIDLAACKIDYLVSSANKCIEGVPGFGFCLVRRAALDAAEGHARSLSLDLLAQLRGLEKNGQFRFTPPTHALLGFHRALLELEQEGGVTGRAQRYQQNYQTLLGGMEALGFATYLPRDLQGYIITSFRYPDGPNWSFEQFYDRLNTRGYVIYPGKVSDADCFRIGNIGRIFPSDVQDLLAAIAQVARAMNLNLASPTPAGG